MNYANHKTMAFAISVFLISLFIISLVALPSATAQNYVSRGTMKTYPFIGAVPNPVGVGQEVLLHVGITQQLASAIYGWEGLTVTVTKPNNTTETLGPFKTDSTGGTGGVYVPTMVGTYYLQTNFPEQRNPEQIRAFGGIAIPENATMLASISEKLPLIVTAEPTEYYPGIPLPTEYWTRPIDAQAREWYTIAGNWLTDPRNLFAPYNDDAPETAHILWTKPHTVGGVVGGALGEATLDALGYHAFECGDAYEGKFDERLIMHGKLYYQKIATAERYQEVACVDLHTGEELWSKVLLDNRSFNFGQLMYWDTYDYHGVYDYLWVTIGSAWHAFDPMTGDWVYTIQGVPSGTTVYGAKGELLRYYMNVNRGFMTLWNSTNIPALYASTTYGSMGWGQWRPFGKTVEATGPANVRLDNQPYIAPTTPLGLNGYHWNVSIPTNLEGSAYEYRPGDRVIGISYNYDEVSVWALSLKPGQEGQLLFNKVTKAPAEWGAGNVSISRVASSLADGDRVVALYVKEFRKYYGYSLDTGDFLWATKESEDYLNIYSRDSRIAYGKLFGTGASGIVYCYNLETGELLWTYHATDPYTEILWANQWWTGALFITDGKIYYGHEEHSPIDPKPRGAPFICLDVETGEEIWRIDGAFRQSHWGGTAIIGDSIIATQDTYDQRIYAIGKGPSSTSAVIRNDVLTMGSSVLIQGMVMDVSPGTEEYTVRARFPNGVPAVADESMSDWMLHVYKQFPHGDIVGVPVYVHVLDANGNYRNIGETTTDPNGFFSLAWIPDIPGKYTVIVSFAGSRAYYPSYAYTAFVVDEAAAATPLPTAEPLTLPPLDMYITVGVALIIIAIAIVGVLLLRKK